MGVFLYVLIIMVLLITGLFDKNAVMCCAAGLFAIAGEIYAKDGDGK